MGVTQASFTGSIRWPLTQREVSIPARWTPESESRDSLSSVHASLWAVRSRVLTSAQPRWPGGNAEECLGSLERGEASQVRSGLSLLGSGQLLGFYDALAFFYVDQLVRLDVFHGIDLAAGPADLEQVDLLGFANSEMNTQVAL